MTQLDACGRVIGGRTVLTQNELPCDKTNKMACAPSKDSDQPGHPLPIECPIKTDQTGDAQADLSLCWVHISLCCFFSCCGSNGFTSTFLKSFINSICFLTLLVYEVCLCCLC